MKSVNQRAAGSTTTSAFSELSMLVQTYLLSSRHASRNNTPTFFFVQFCSSDFACFSISFFAAVFVRTLEKEVSSVFLENGGENQKTGTNSHIYRGTKRQEQIHIYIYADFRVCTAVMCCFFLSILWYIYADFRLCTSVMWLFFFRA